MSSVYNTSNIIHCPLYRQVGLIRCVCFVKKTWPVKRNTCSERLKLLLKQVVKFSHQGKTYSFFLLLECNRNRNEPQVYQLCGKFKCIVYITWILSMLDFYKVLRVEAVLRLICGILSSPKKMGESNFPAWGIIFGISGGGDNVKKKLKTWKTLMDECYKFQTKSSNFT